MRLIVPWLLALAGVVMFVAVAATTTRRPPRGLSVLEGAATVEDGVLHLSPGAVVDVGEGTSVAVTGAFSGREFDLVRSAGPGQSSRGRLGEVAGIYADSGQVLGDDPPTAVHLGDASTVTLQCAGMVELLVDGRRAAAAPPVPNCDRAARLQLAAVTPVSIAGLVVEKRPVALLPAAPAASRLVGAAALGGALGLLAGPQAAGVLLLAPLALWGSKLGLPADAVLGLLWAAAASVGLSGVQRWRRVVGGALAASGLLAAAGLTWTASRDGAPPAWLADRAAWVAVDASLVRRKVDIVARRARPEVAKVDPRPQVLALGSSSSGGGTHGMFWPKMLGDALPAAHVVNLAEGGATTWHMVEVVEALDLRPAACVLYMGHNDVAPSLPGGTIKQVVEGSPLRAGTWVAPVPVGDLPPLLSRLSERCEVLLVMHEYEQRPSEHTDDWVAAARATPGVVYRDVWPLFVAGGNSFMVDEVHPSAQGQAALATFIAAELRPLLAANGHPQPAVTGP